MRLRDLRRVPLANVVLVCIAAAAVVVVVVGLAFGGSVGEGSSEVTAATVDLEEGGDAVGQIASGTFETVDGGQADLDSYRGNPLVLNFFASWCTQCITEMPAFEQVHQTMGASVTFLGVAARDVPADTDALVADTGVTYDIGRDQRGDLLLAFGGTSLPTTVLIDAEGVITSVNTGALTAAELTQKVEAELLP